MDLTDKGAEMAVNYQVGVTTFLSTSGSHSIYIPFWNEASATVSLLMGENTENTTMRFPTASQAGKQERSEDSTATLGPIQQRMRDLGDAMAASDESQ